MRRRHPVPLRDKRCPPRRAGFSLPELLASVAILAVLLALLFPALRKARRAAVALAAPVAYLGADSRVHATDARGGLDLQFDVVANRTMQCPVCHAPPSWSPSGQTLAFSLMAQGQRLTAFVEPASGKLRTVREDRYFLGWLDGDTYLETQGLSALFVRRAGGPPSHDALANEARVAFIAPAPAGAPGPYIASVQSGPRGMVTFLRKDMSLGRPVWVEPAAGVLANEQPRVTRRANSSPGASGATRTITRTPRSPGSSPSSTSPSRRRARPRSWAPSTSAPSSATGRKTAGSWPTSVTTTARGAWSSSTARADSSGPSTPRPRRPPASSPPGGSTATADPKRPTPPPGRGARGGMTGRSSGRP